MKDQTLHKHMARAAELKARIADLEVGLSEEKAVIAAELARRGITTIEGDGARAVLTSRRTGYSLDRWKARVKAGVFRSTTKLVVDATAVKQLKKAGQVTDEDIKAAEERSQPYVLIDVLDPT